MIPQFIPYWGQAEKDAVLDVLDSDYLNEHKTVRKFEEKFAEFVGAKHCVTFTSGTMAIFNAIKSQPHYAKWAVPDHDGLFAFNSVIGSGSLPVIYDVNEDGLMKTFVQQSIIVQANGRITDVPLIEDCSQATDHHTKDKISTYSFASTKHITTAGQGGAVCCDDKDTFDALTKLKDHGRNDRQTLKPMSDEFKEWGMNFKFTEVQAAFGLAQLSNFKQRIARFKEIHSIYHDILKDSVKFDETIPRWYVDVFVDDPDSTKAHLNKNGFGARRFPKPLHTQELCKACNVDTTSEFPNTVQRYSKGLYLPSTTNLSDEEVKRIAGCII